MHNHAPRDYCCPFCLLIQGISNPQVLSVQSDMIVHEERVSAFIGSHQWLNNPGNVIVIPNIHYENIYDLPLKFLPDIYRVVKRLALAMKIAYNCDGVSTRQHNEPAGNQDVWHYHVHVTPRYLDDNFYGTLSQWKLMPVEERAQHAETLRNALACVNE